MNTFNKLSKGQLLRLTFIDHLVSTINKPIVVLFLEKDDKMENARFFNFSDEPWIPGGKIMLSYSWFKSNRNGQIIFEVIL